MKYIPEEMYNYAADNGLLYVLFLAINNTDIFSCMPAEGTLYAQDDKMFIRVTQAGEPAEMLDFEVKGEEYRALIKTSQKYPVRLKCVVYCAGDAFYLLTSFSGDEKRIWQDKGVWKDIWKKLFIEFLNFTKTDTPGRLKTLIRQGLESYENWCQAEDFLKDKGIPNMQDEETDQINAEYIAAIFDLISEKGGTKTDEELYQFVGLRP